MIEPLVRKRYQQLCINPLLNQKFLQKVHPNFLTSLACLVGLCTYPLLSLGYTISALLFLAVSGFLDTLDGAFARASNRSSSKGAALDILCDRIVEFTVVLGLYAIDPIARAPSTIFMLGSILLCVTSFLVVGIFTENKSEKSFFYSPGLIERAEAFVFFALMILFPSIFLFLSYLFSFLVCTTAFIRIAQFLKHPQS